VKFFDLMIFPAGGLLKSPSNTFVKVKLRKAKLKNQIVPAHREIAVSSTLFLPYFDFIDFIDFLWGSSI
jgi:hypothetical protein